jgi:hypothetical protein
MRSSDAFRRSVPAIRPRDASSRCVVAINLHSLLAAIVSVMSMHRDRVDSLLK